MKTSSVIKCATLLFIGSVSVCSCGKKDDAAKQAQQQQQNQVPELTVETLAPETVTMFTSYPATLHGSNDVEIRPQISGFLTQVLVTEGQRVVAGQVLFTIDQVQLQAAVDAAQQQLSQAQSTVLAMQANVNTAKTKADADKILLDQNIISKTAYQFSVDALNSAKAQLAQTQAAVKAAQANLVSAQKNLSYTVVRAPESGIIGSIDYKAGALVSPQTLLTVLSGSNEIEAYFSFTEQELLATTGEFGSIQNAIAKMPAVSLRLANGSMYPLKGRVVSVSGVLDAATGSATAKAAFPNPDGLLHSGNSAQVLIPVTYKDVIVLPQTATFEIQGLKYAFVVDEAGKLLQTPITISEQNDGKSYIVTSGLEPGQTVLVEGVGMNAKDGMTIKPKAASAATQQPAN